MLDIYLKKRYEPKENSKGKKDTNDKARLIYISKDDIKYVNENILTEEERKNYLKQKQGKIMQKRRSWINLRKTHKLTAWSIYL